MTEMFQGLESLRLYRGRSDLFGYLCCCSCRVVQKPNGGRRSTGAELLKQQHPCTIWSTQQEE